jgi:hypothetical protein
MICICFSSGVIISHHLSLCLKNNGHQHDSMKWSAGQNIPGVPSHQWCSQKWKMTYKWLFGTWDPSMTLTFLCISALQGMGKSTKPNEARNKHAIYRPDRVWRWAARGEPHLGHCMHPGSVMHSQSWTETALLQPSSGFSPVMPFMAQCLFHLLPVWWSSQKSEVWAITLTPVSSTSFY